MHDMKASGHEHDSHSGSMPGMDDWRIGADINEEPEQHAFTILGDKALFLVHMTMFMMEAHALQAILRISLPDEIIAALRTERQANPGTTYFLGNSETDLLTMSEIQAGVRTRYNADVFRGIPWAPSYAFWPWRGTRPVFANVPVTIDRVVHFRRFDLNMNRPNNPTYLLFGEGEEAHLHNLQIAPPEYDHVLSLAGRPDWLHPTQLAAGAPINFPDLKTCPKGCKCDAPCQDPLPPGFYPIQYRGTETVRQIQVARTWWFSTKVVNPMDPCAATDTIPPEEPLP